MKLSNLVHLVEIFVRISCETERETVCDHLALWPQWLIGFIKCIELMTVQIDPGGIGIHTLATAPHTALVCDLLL